MPSDSAPAGLSLEQARRIALSIAKRLGKPNLGIGSHSGATTRFVRNELAHIGGRDDRDISLSVRIGGAGARVFTNDELHAESLAALIAEAETLAGERSSAPAGLTFGETRTFPHSAIHFDSSIAAGAADFQSELVRRVTDMIRKAGLIGTGAVSTTTRSLIVLHEGSSAYSRQTYGEFAVNVRTPSGKGSGWAWSGTEDFSKVDPAAVTERAIDICRRSDNPVAVEPGRYTVILEPEAMAQLLDDPIFKSGTRFLSLHAANTGETVFSRFDGKKLAGNKIGLQMTDRRVQLFSDPMDPDIPYSPLADDGGQLERIPWIENGVLKNLAGPAGVSNPMVGKLQIDGQTQAIEEMIANTTRGIWVHRFTDPFVMSPLTLLLTGVTRDGTFLIENGKVTRAVKNLRFSESPFFILNKIEAFGAPVRANVSIACPRLKVRDFEFTSLSDAI